MVREEIVEIGQVKHFFSKLNVAILDLTAPLAVGDRILIRGPVTHFEQTVTSMQAEYRSIQRAEGKQSVGLKLDQPAKAQDMVYKKL